MYHIKFHERIRMLFTVCKYCICISSRAIFFQFEKCVKYANEMTDDIIHSTKYYIKCIRRAILANLQCRPLNLLGLWYQSYTICQFFPLFCSQISAGKSLMNLAGSWHLCPMITVNFVCWFSCVVVWSFCCCKPFCLCLALFRPGKEEAKWRRQREEIEIKHKER